MLTNLHLKINSGITISAITLAELAHGVEESKYPEKNSIALSQFLSIVEVLPFDDGAAIEYGKICTTLRRQGTPIWPMDMLIAAHARAKGLTVVTNNVREFERVDNLKIENWATP